MIRGWKDATTDRGALFLGMLQVPSPKNTIPHKDYMHCTPYPTRSLHVELQEKRENYNYKQTTL